MKMRPVSLTVPPSLLQAIAWANSCTTFSKTHVTNIQNQLVAEKTAPAEAVNLSQCVASDIKATNIVNSEIKMAAGWKIQPSAAVHPSIHLSGFPIGNFIQNGFNFCHKGCFASSPDCSPTEASAAAAKPFSSTKTTFGLPVVLRGRPFQAFVTKSPEHARMKFLRLTTK